MRCAAGATRRFCRTCTRSIGPRFVERLDGMFAIALWDAARKRLVLARDRLGKKPLVWTRLDDGTIAFASELKAFHALPQLPRRGRSARARRLPRAPVRPGDAHGSARRAAARARLAADRRGRQRHDRALLAAAGPTSKRQPTTSGSNACARRDRCRAKAARLGRAARRTAVGRPRLGDRRCADGSTVGRTDPHVHRRIRRRALRRARVRTSGRRPLWDASRGDRPRAGRRRHATAARGGIRRAARRRSCAAALSHLRGGTARGDRRTRRRRRRRVVRRLRALHSDGSRRAGACPSRGRRCAAVSAHFLPVAANAARRYSAPRASSKPPPCRRSSATAA